MAAHTKAFSLLELLIVLAIVLILMSIVFAPKSYERDKFARDTLRLAWQAEKDFFAFSFKGSEDMLSGSAETYTTDWSKLFCGDPNSKDQRFQYSIEEATSTALKIKATHKQKPGHFFSIDQDGIIVDEKGKKYIMNAEGKEQIQ